ncbi:hypothetical protein MUK42_19380 [Musa troglodytarum]|uniref:Uncharacterized protein n=1 Tax=Musa troglodytarum TaxID=320322 RepID=A0A9E7GDX7_9LILI|nr:hypothetical protein MUK42_19380 [Musa troglodytarum]
MDCESLELRREKNWDGGKPTASNRKARREEMDRRMGEERPGSDCARRVAALAGKTRKAATAAKAW